MEYTPWCSGHVLKYKKSTIDHTIYSKDFSEGTVSYLTVSTDNVINTTNNEIAYPKINKSF